MEYALNLGVVINIGALRTLEYYKDKLNGKNVFLRINPKIGAGTSHHVITGGPKSKFGIYENDLMKAI
jgi:diaminopimelate decarboxylase